MKNIYINVHKLRLSIVNVKKFVWNTKMAACLQMPFVLCFLIL